MSWNRWTHSASLAVSVCPPNAETAPSSSTLSLCVQDGSLDADDLDSLQEFYNLRGKAQTAAAKTLRQDTTSDDSSGGGGSAGPSTMNPPGGGEGVDSKPNLESFGSGKRPMQQQGQRVTALQKGSSSLGASSLPASVAPGERPSHPLSGSEVTEHGGESAGTGSGAEEAAAKTIAAKAAASVLSAIRPAPTQLLPLKVMIKPKKVVPVAPQPPIAATEQPNGGSSPSGGGLMGLGGYGSGSEDSQ